MPTVRRVLLLAAWVGLLSAVALGLPQLTPGLPPVTDLSGWSEWAARRSAIDIVFGGASVLLRALAWYLLGTSVLGVLLRVLRAGAAVRYLDVITLPPVRRLLQFALGVGLAGAGLTTGGADVSEHHGGGATAAIVALAEAQTAHANQLGADADIGELRYLGDDPASVEQVVRADVAMQHGVLAAEDAGQLWEVRSGDHFWGIAEEVLSEAWERTPSDAEVLPYWQALIAANEDRLPDPGNPDLLFPGQELVVPTPPAAD